MLNALLAIIPITILFFWFKSMGDKENKPEYPFDESDWYNKN